MGASDFLAVLRRELGGDTAPFLDVVERALTSAGRGETAIDFCEPAWIAGVGEAVARAATDPAVRAPGVPAAGALLRNLGFLVVVLVHGFRRLLPPY